MPSLSGVARSAASRIPEPARRRLAHLADRSPLVARAHRGYRDALQGEGRIARGPAAGLRFDASGHITSYALGTAEPDVQEALAELVAPGEVAYDGGTASGFFTVLLAGQVGPTGRVVAFEPDPENAERTQHNLDLNAFAHVELRRTALSEAAGVARFRLGYSPATGERDPNRGGLTAVAPRTTDDEEIEVRVECIDELVASGAIPPPDVIKLDVENAEVGALRGARRTIAEHRPRMLIETHDTAAEVDALLREMGYRVRCLTGGPPAEAGWSEHLLALPPAG